jgi:transcriptional regulator of NAD metabolism
MFQIEYYFFMGQKQSKNGLGSSAVPLCLVYSGRLAQESVSVVKRLVNQHQLAPFYPPLDAGTECPLCFIAYPQLNHSACCHQPLCSDCFVQFRRTKPNYESVKCPYCQQQDFKVCFLPSNKINPDSFTKAYKVTAGNNIKLTKDDLNPDWQKIKENEEREVTQRLQQLENNQLRLRQFGLLQNNLIINRYEDVEELMINEAIRLSMLNASPVNSRSDDDLKAVLQASLRSSEAEKNRIEQIQSSSVTNIPSSYVVQALPVSVDIKLSPVKDQEWSLPSSVAGSGDSVKYETGSADKQSSAAVKDTLLKDSLLEPSVKETSLKDSLLKPSLIEPNVKESLLQASLPKPSAVSEPLIEQSCTEPSTLKTTLLKVSSIEQSSNGSHVVEMCVNVGNDSGTHLNSDVIIPSSSGDDAEANNDV